MAQGVDSGTLSTVGSIIAGFGVAMLFFRIQRELQMGKSAERIWIPWADWLLIGATLTALLVVLIPLIVLRAFPWAMHVATAACGAGVLLVAGYIFAILAHYRLLFGQNSSGPRTNPEPAERVVVTLSLGVAVIGFIVLAVLGIAGAI
jgi:hypothetical protein